MNETVFLFDFDGIVGTNFVTAETTDTFFSVYKHFMRIFRVDLQNLHRTDVETCLATGTPFSEKNRLTLHPPKAGNTF